MIGEAVPTRAFTLHFTARAADIDVLGHVNNAVWVRWIQDVATGHWAAFASVDEQAALIWVVARHEIDYLKPLLVGERVAGHTWVADAARGARFDRHMAFVGDDGKQHLRARTTWALLDRASSRPMRVPAAMVARFGLGAAGPSVSAG